MGNSGRNGGRGPVPIDLGVAQQLKRYWYKGQPHSYLPPQPRTFTITIVGSPDTYGKIVPGLQEYRLVLQLLVPQNRQTLMCNCQLLWYLFLRHLIHQKTRVEAPTINRIVDA